MGPWKADGLAGDPTRRGPIAFRVLTCVAKCADRQELMRAGVYFLLGIDDDTEERQVHIGESGNVLLRLKQHIAILSAKTIHSGKTERVFLSKTSRKKPMGK